jgi:ABC-2 type transport system permease protein
MHAEWRKLAAQLPLRLLAIVCVVAPFAFAVVLAVQSGTPSDALFGVWVHTSGFAISLVVLGFSAAWGFPIVAGVLAGDLFASEDRHGTWKTLLTRSRTLDEVFVGKVLAAMSFAVALTVLLAIASLMAGLIVVGGRPMVDLSGRELSAPHLLVLVSLSWLLAIPGVLAYASLAMFISVATRNAIIGVLGPLLVALLSQLLALIGNGVWVHLLLIGSTFDAWHGLFVRHPYFGPLVVSLLVSAAWIAASLGLGWCVLRRREFIPTEARRMGWQRPVRLVAAGVAIVALLALGTNLGPAGVTTRRVATSFAPEFHRLTILQQDLLGHPIPAGARYRILPVCGRRGGRGVGQGEWTCTMNVYVLLSSGTQPLTDTPVTYDMSIQSNGCFRAQSPPVVVGAAQIRDTAGRSVVNPLVTIYGCFDVL